MITMHPTFTRLSRKKSRFPFQVAVFHFPNHQNVYLSDMSLEHIDFGNHFHDCKPLIESWGTLTSNSEIRAAIKGGALEAKELSLSIINAGHNRFINNFKRFGVENVNVDIYQGLSDKLVTKGEKVYLMDSFICVPPIHFEEASMLLRVSMVSTIMKHNPYITGERTDDELRYPYVIGSVKKLPLIDLQTSRWTTLVEDIDANTASPLCIGENTIGFSSSGLISIDSEVFKYTSLSKQKFHITARGLRGTQKQIHRMGARITIPDSNYDYAVCAGPVHGLGHLLVNGKAYPNESTFFHNTDPAIVRFRDRPPWIKTNTSSAPNVQPPNETVSFYGTKSHSVGAGVTSPGNVNNPVSACSLKIVSKLSGGEKNDFTSGGSASCMGGEITKVSCSSGHAKFTLQNYDTSQNGESFPGAVTMPFGTNPGVTGKLTSSRVTINASCNEVFGAAVRFKLFLVTPGGNKVELENMHSDALNQERKLAPWNNLSRVISLDSYVNSWQDLKSCSIKVELHTYDSDYNKSRHCTTTVTSKWNFTYFEDPNSVPIVENEVQSIFGSDQHIISDIPTAVSVTASVDFSTSVTDAEVERSIVVYDGSVPTGTIRWSDTITRTNARRSVNVHVSTAGIKYSDLKNVKIGLKQRVVGVNKGGVTRVSETVCWEIKWFITYKPKEISGPSETTVIYAEEITADVVGASGPHITPSAAIHKLLNDHGFSKQLNGPFAIADRFYKSNNLYFNGVIDAGTRLHEAIKEMLRQSVGRLIYNEGEIKFLSPAPFRGRPIEIDKDRIALRSFSDDRGNTDLIVNDLELGYDIDYTTGRAREKVLRSDIDSIERYSIKELKVDCPLINSSQAINTYADLLITKYSSPADIITFRTYMNAYPIEKGDMVIFETDFEDLVKARGEVFSVSRIFGKGKTGQINVFEIMLVNVESFFNRPYWYDIIEVKDKGLTFDKGAEVGLYDRVTVKDSGLFLQTETGYGTGGYGVHPYGG